METNITLAHLDMAEVHSHYVQRYKLHQKMVAAFTAKDAAAYSNLALGISDPAGNYSAAEHHLGNMIVKVNGADAILALAQTLYAAPSPKKLPALLTTADVKYLKISIGSEMSMLLRPDTFWTTNVRTVWAHLLNESGDDYKEANDALSVFRGDSDDKKSSHNWDAPDMSYALWSDFHVKLETTLKRLSSLGVAEAEKQGVKPGKLRFLWADAIANEMYRLRSQG